MAKRWSNRSMDVEHVADAVLYMASLAVGCQCAVYDGDGDEHAVHRTRLRDWRPLLWYVSKRNPSRNGAVAKW